MESTNKLLGKRGVGLTNQITTAKGSNKIIEKKIQKMLSIEEKLEIEKGDLATLDPAVLHGLKREFLKDKAIDEIDNIKAVQSQKLTFVDHDFIQEINPLCTDVIIICF